MENNTTISLRSMIHFPCGGLLFTVAGTVHNNCANLPELQRVTVSHQSVAKSQHFHTIVRNRKIAKVLAGNLANRGLIDCLFSRTTLALRHLRVFV